MVAEPVNLMMGRRSMMAEPTNQGDENIVPFKRGSSKERIMVKPQYLEDAELRIHLPAKAKEFLQYLNKGTYCKKGIHDNEGSAVHWCLFDMRTCMNMLDTYKPNVIRIRNYLVALRVIETRLDADGQLWIGWNLNTDEWLSSPKHGGMRAGAGHPKRFQDDNERTAQKPIQDDNEIFQDDNEQARKRFQDDNERTARRTTATSVATPLRNVTKNLQELTDANASGDAACADAPSAILASPLPIDVTGATLATANSVTPPRTLPKRRSAAARASPKTPPTPLEDYRAACFALLREKYGNALAKEGRELAAIKRLFEKKISLEDVEGCWQATLLDPRWDTDPLTMAIIEEKLQVYLRGPLGYREGMQRKRENDNQRKQQQERGKTNGTGRNFQQRATGISQPSDTHTKAAKGNDAASLLLDGGDDD